MQNFSGGQNFSFPKLLKLVNCDGKIDVSLMSHRTNARTYTYQIKVLLNSLHFYGSSQHQFFIFEFNFENTTRLVGYVHECS